MFLLDPEFTLVALGLSNSQKLKFPFDGNSFLKFWVDDKLCLKSQTLLRSLGESW